MTTFDFDSMPDKMEELFSSETSTERQIEICERYNLEIADYYHDNLTRAEKTFWEFQNDVFQYDLSITKYQLIKRQLLQVKGIWKAERIEKKDTGVTINGKESKVIKDSYQRLINYLDGAIPVLDDFIQVTDGNIKKATKIENIKMDKPKLSMKQIALKYYYEGKLITRANGNEIARQYGQNSGEKLFHEFTYFSSTANRTGSEDSEKKLINKIKLISSIVDSIEEPYNQRAIDELKNLNNTVGKGVL